MNKKEQRSIMPEEGEWDPLDDPEALVAKLSRQIKRAEGGRTSRLDSALSEMSEAADRRDAAKTLADRLRPLTDKETTERDGVFTLNRHMSRGSFDGGTVEDEAGRTATISFEMWWQGNQTLEIPVDLSREDLIVGTNDEWRKKLTEPNAMGVNLSLVVGLDMVGGKTTETRVRLGRLVGVDGNGKLAIVNPDWDDFDYRVKTGKRKLEDGEQEPPMLLDPDSDEYKEAVEWLLRAADSEGQKAAKD